MSNDPTTAAPLPGEGQERELYPSCLALNRPGTQLCSNCGAPLSSYATTAPFVSLFAEGHAYRQAVEKPRNWIVLLGMWLLFGLSATIGFVFLTFGNQDDPRAVVSGGFLLMVSVAILARTTWNYATSKPVQQPDDELLPAVGTDAA